jgi:hypothetical protein
MAAQFRGSCGQPLGLRRAVTIFTTSEREAQAAGNPDRAPKARISRRRWMLAFVIPAPARSVEAGPLFRQRCSRKYLGIGEGFVVRTNATGRRLAVATLQLLGFRPRNAIGEKQCAKLI